MPKTAAIIVTCNSEKVLGHCLDALSRQSHRADTIYLVDSGSDDAAYVHRNGDRKDIVVLPQEDNIGFSRANNIGYVRISEETEYVLFLNPDTLLEQAFLERAVQVMENGPDIGIVTGRLLGFNFDSLRASSRIDSTGIFRHWYGRWYDRGQGEMNNNQYNCGQDIPAACGALMFCRKSALDRAALAKNIIFDPDFFLYKEDIELSLRMRKSGWRIRYEPYLTAYHGRGWQKSRKNMDRRLRLMAARNEVLLYRKHPSPYMLWSLAKYFLVSAFNI